MYLSHFFLAKSKVFEHVIYVMISKSLYTYYTTTFIFSFRRLKKSPKFFPTCYPEQYDDLADEEYAEGMFKFTDPTISFWDLQ